MFFFLLKSSQQLFRPLSTKFRCLQHQQLLMNFTTINNNNSILDNPRPVSSLLELIRQEQSRETAVEFLPRGLKYKVLKRPFVGKVVKIDTTKSFTVRVQNPSGFHFVLFISYFLCFSMFLC